MLTLSHPLDHTESATAQQSGGTSFFQFGRPDGLPAAEAAFTHLCFCRTTPFLASVSDG